MICPLSCSFLKTFAGSAGHPVLVDYVGRAIKLTHASPFKTGLSEDTLKDWAGPGLFADCVFRYVPVAWIMAS